MSLSLYDPPSLLHELGTKPLPPLLSPAAETHAVHSFLESTARYFAFLHGPRMLEMLRIHHATPTHHGFFVSQHQPDVTSPGGLRPDERAMVYAAICLGRFKEIPPISAGPGVQVPASGSRHNSTTGMGTSGSSQLQANNLGMSAPAFGAGVRQEPKTVPLSVRLREMREDSGYFCRAVLELQKWGGASLTALGEPSAPPTGSEIELTGQERCTACTFLRSSRAALPRCGTYSAAWRGRFARWG